MAVDRHDDEGRFWLLVAVCALLVAASLVFLAATPEPCTDGTTTVCASASRTAP